MRYRLYIFFPVLNTVAFKTISSLFCSINVHGHAYMGNQGTIKMQREVWNNIAKLRQPSGEATAKKCEITPNERRGYANGKVMPRQIKSETLSTVKRNYGQRKLCQTKGENTPNEIRNYAKWRAKLRQTRGETTSNEIWNYVKWKAKIR